MNDVQQSITQDTLSANDTHQFPTSIRPNIKGAINLRKFTSLKQLAAILKLDKSGLRRYIKGLGIKGELRRMPDSRDQLTLSYKVEEVKAILQARQALGHTAAFPDFE